MQIAGASMAAISQLRLKKLLTNGKCKLLLGPKYGENIPKLNHEFLPPQSFRLPVGFGWDSKLSKHLDGLKYDCRYNKRVPNSSEQLKHG